MKKQTRNRQFVGLVILAGALFLWSLLFQPLNRADAKPPGRGNETSDKAVKAQSIISSSFLFGSPCFNRLRPADLVFVVDTSGSMLDDQFMVNYRFVLSNAIIDDGITLMSVDLGITESLNDFNLLDNVLNRFGDTVPGNPLLNCGPLDDNESWAAGTAIVAERYPWRENAVRIIIPISDEEACRGEPCDFMDEKSIENAISIAQLHNVTVFPVIITNSTQCVLEEGFSLGFFTGGKMFLSHQSGLAQAIGQLVRDSTGTPLDDNIRTGGVADDFQENVAVELASPSSALATILAECPLGAADFDQMTLGACFGHTLIGIPQPEVIIAATLEIRVKAFGTDPSNLPCDDFVALQTSGGFPEFLWSRRIGTRGILAACDGPDGLLPDSWISGDDVVLSLDLTALPNEDGTTTNLLPQILADDRLDIFVDSSTSVDYVKLTIVGDYDCNANGVLDCREIGRFNQGVINGDLSNEVVPWVRHERGDGTVSYLANNITVTGVNDGAGDVVWASQFPIEFALGTLEFDLISYSNASDILFFDYPVLYVDGLIYPLNLDGTVSGPSAGRAFEAGTIHNSSTVSSPIHFIIDVDALAGPGPHEIGFGVVSSDGTAGAGVAVFDNVSPPFAGARETDCNANKALDECEFGLENLGVVNGNVDAGQAPWVSQVAGDGMITYDQEIVVQGRDDGRNNTFVWASQGPIQFLGRHLTFQLKKYTSGDFITADYPVFFLDGLFYGLNQDGTLGSPTTGGLLGAGTISNENPVLGLGDVVSFSVNVDALAGSGPHEIGFGVHSFDGMRSPGIATFDNILPEFTPTPLDCNLNSIPDACDIASGTSLDSDLDGVPDECANAADINGDGIVNVTDLLALLGAWGLCGAPCPADIDMNGAVNVTDLLTLLANWG